MVVADRSAFGMSKNVRLSLPKMAPQTEENSGKSLEGNGSLISPGEHGQGSDDREECQLSEMVLLAA